MSLIALWLPILVAAILVFVASSLIHMVVGYHVADYGRVASEDAFMDAARTFNIPPGDYFVPCPTRQGMRDPEFVAKHRKGPVVMMTVFPAGAMGMGRQLVMWFVYCLVVGVFAAHLATLAAGPAAAGPVIFHVTAIVAFIGYGLPSGSSRSGTAGSGAPRSARRLTRLFIAF